MKRILLILGTLLVAANEMVLCEWPKFLYFQKANDTPKALTSTGLLPASFPKTRITFFVIHGWNGDPYTDYMTELRTNLFKNLPQTNVIMVDWRGGGSDQSNYFVSAANTKTNGKKIADFINKNKLNISLVHCVGHSLGAHSCGFVGKNLKGKMARISGLDPAGPNFNIGSTDRLLSTDAIFVDVIHTNIFLGTSIQSGHVDFYINFNISLTQPQCKGSKDVLGCNHIAAVRYFGASIAKSCGLSGSFCTKTSNILGVFTGCTQLDKNKRGTVGYFANKQTKGIYDVITNSLCKS